MKPLSFNGPQDYLALLVRRKWWILLPFLVLSSAITLVTYVPALSLWLPTSALVFGYSRARLAAMTLIWARA